MRDNDLLDRTFNFGVNCIKFLRNLPNYPEYKIIRFQICKSATSLGANYEESQAGSSLKDFRNKIRISLRETRETNYWLRIIKSLNDFESSQLDALLKESFELKNIFGSILNKTKDKKDNNN